jgi:hypothetical protein
VKDALQPILKDVGRALGVDVSANDGPKKKGVRAKDFQDKGKKEAHMRKERPSPPPDESDPEASETDRKRNADFDLDDSEDDFAQFDDRLASSEEDDDDAPEDGEDDDDGSDIDVDELERKLAAEGIGKTKSKASTSKATYDHAADLSLDEDDDETSGSGSPEPQKASAPKKALTFIPSLTMAGYISGSGSDIDDEVDVAPKKNRRGQRARQQIWEKKYGTRAKHLQKEKEKRDQGWDPKRGATDGSGKHGKGKPDFKGKRMGPHGRPDGPRKGAGAQQPRAAKKHRDDSGPIHPSWESAKRAKEKKEAPVAFQGKKITFD